MTDEEISGLSSAFGSYLGQYRDCFLQERTAAHFDDFCRGLLSDLPRKSAEPIALASGTAVRTMQEFLSTAHWDHLRARDTLQSHIADTIATLPRDSLGTIGVIDETSCLKKGTKTPGVQRQYLGCVGKIDNGIVTVHVGVAYGRFQALLDADLYLPESWDNDRKRCSEAGIPDGVRYLPKWRIALSQILRLHHNGVRFDWLTFDEGYGSKVPLLGLLSLAGLRFVGEVPVNFSVRLEQDGQSRRADEVLTAEHARRGRRFRFARRTVQAQWWRAARVEVLVDGRAYVLVVAINEASGEVKYFVSNGVGQPLGRLLRVAFRRATIEHGFRLAKQEAGLMHYEGRWYVGLHRHLMLALIVLGFVSIHTDRLWGGKSTGDDGAGVPGIEPALRDAVAPPQGDIGIQPRRLRHPLPPRPQRGGHPLPQKAAA
jgi:SRSO17 transposase